MTLLNERYDYGLHLQLLSIDEGISGYRDDSLLTVQRNSEQYKLPLKILSYSDLYEGWTMDKVVKETGKKGNCTYCGVFRRKALDLGGDVLEVDHIVTGHNADDVAETVLMNGTCDFLGGWLLFILKISVRAIQADCNLEWNRTVSIRLPFHPTTLP